MGSSGDSFSSLPHDFQLVRKSPEALELLHGLELQLLVELQDPFPLKLQSD